jgi:hypothetical protein
VADATLVGQRGTTIGYRFPIAVGGVPVDLTLPNTVVTFTAKRRRSDVEPLLEKSYRAVPGTSDPGFGLVASTTDTLELDIAPGDTAPTAEGAFAQTEFLVYDVILTEPDGRTTAVAKGPLTVRAGTGS